MNYIYLIDNVNNQPKFVLLNNDNLSKEFTDQKELIDTVKASIKFIGQVPQLFSVQNLGSYQKVNFDKLDAPTKDTFNIVINSDTLKKNLKVPKNQKYSVLIKCVQGNDLYGYIVTDTQGNIDLIQAKDVKAKLHCITNLQMNGVEFDLNATIPVVKIDFVDKSNDITKYVDNLIANKSSLFKRKTRNETVRAVKLDKEGTYGKNRKQVKVGFYAVCGNVNIGGSAVIYDPKVFVSEFTYISKKKSEEDAKTIQQVNSDATKDVLNELDEEKAELVRGLLNIHRQTLENQKNFILSEGSLAVVCPKGIQYLYQEKKKISFNTICSILDTKDFVNGDFYYKLLSAESPAEEIAKIIEKEKIDLVAKFKKIQGVITPNSPQFIQLKDEILNSCKVVIINEFVQDTTIKFIVYTSKIDKPKLQNSHYFTIDLLDTNGITTSLEQGQLNRYMFGYYSNQAAYEARPFFATRVKQEILADVKKRSEFNPIIGRTYSNKSVSLKFGGGDIPSSFVFLVAGSRSGKGVLTLCQLSEAIAKGYNTFYIDCKPDMSMSIYNNIVHPRGLETFAIDGFNYSEAKHIDINVGDKSYKEYAIQKLEEQCPGLTNILQDDQLGLFINLLGYTRAISDISYIGKKQAEENNRENKQYGSTPCFVVIDEIEQYCKSLQDMFFAGEIPSRNVYGGTVGQIIENTSVPDHIRNYLKSIIRYIRTTWTTFGNMSQSILGQSLLRIFVICQHTHIDSWCKPVSKALNLYSNGATYILGNESHQGPGAEKYGCANFKEDRPSLENKTKALDYLGMGKFILKKGNSYTPFKSIFLLNESTRNLEGHPSSYVKEMYGRLTDKEVRRLVNKELFGIDDYSTFDELQDKPLVETGIGFREFADWLCKASGKEYDAVHYLQNGYNYLQKHMSKYSKGLWNKFYDFSYESLGISESLDTAFIKEIKQLLQSPRYKVLLDSRYIKLYEPENRYDINVPKYITDMQKTANLNKFWDIYEKQSKGYATREDVKSNQNIFDDLLSKMGQYPPKSLLEEKNEKIEAELQIFVENCKQEKGQEPTKEELEARKQELEYAYRDEFSDEAINAELPEDKTEYIEKIKAYAQGTKYHDLFGDYLKLDVDHNQYLIVNTEYYDRIIGDTTGLGDIYKGQLAKDNEGRGPKKTAAEADSQTAVFDIIKDWFIKDSKTIKSTSKTNAINTQSSIEEQYEYEDEVVDAKGKVNKQAVVALASKYAEQKDFLKKQQAGLYTLYDTGEYSNLIKTTSAQIKLPDESKLIKMTQEQAESKFMNAFYKTLNQNKIGMHQVKVLQLTPQEIIVNEQRVHVPLPASINIANLWDWTFNSVRVPGITPKLNPTILSISPEFVDTAYSQNGLKGGRNTAVIRWAFKKFSKLQDFYINGLVVHRADYKQLKGKELELKYAQKDLEAEQKDRIKLYSDLLNDGEDKSSNKKDKSEGKSKLDRDIRRNRYDGYGRRYGLGRRGPARLGRGLLRIGKKIIALPFKLLRSLLRWIF